MTDKEKEEEENERIPRGDKRKITHGDGEKE